MLCANRFCENNQNCLQAFSLAPSSQVPSLTRLPIIPFIVGRDTKTRFIPFTVELVFEDHDIGSLRIKYCNYPFNLDATPLSLFDFYLMMF